MNKAVILGILFGIIIQRSRINTFDKISGFAIRKDYTVAKIILTAIGTGCILLFLEIQTGMATLHIKSFNLGGIIIGGVIFGIGMAILGYCPGTLIVSMGEGALDAVVGIIGGLTAGTFFIFIYPRIGALSGPDMGKINLYIQSTAATGFIVFLFSSLLIGAAVYIDKKEKRKEM